MTEMETDVSFSVEASWLPSHGSLDSTVICATENPPDGPEIESRPLILTPLQDSGPCEITLNFEGSLCEVSTVYVRSTARIFELYSKSEIGADNEYICTARGELALQNDDPNPVRETINKDGDFSFAGGSCDSNLSKNSPSSSIEIRTKLLLNTDECDGESVTCPSQSDSIEENTYDTLQNLSMEGSIRVSEENAKSESHCSDEDSWIEVKLSGSLVDARGKNTGMSQPQSLGYKDPSEGKAVQESGASVKHCADKISEHDNIAVNQQHKSAEGAHFNGHLSENLSTMGESNPVLENEVSSKARADESSVIFSRNRFPKKALYEASVEIINATPCVSLTMRLLSLQDKSFVEIDAICIYGRCIADDKYGTEPIGLSSFGAQGSPLGGSLLAMLIPSMLQMSRGGLNECRDELLYNFRRDKSMSQMGSSESEPSRSSHPPSTPFSVKDLEYSIGGNSSCDTVPGKSVLAELLPVEEKFTPCLDKVGENLEQNKNNLKTTMQNTLPSVVQPADICLRQGRQNELESENCPVGGMYTEEPTKQHSHEHFESNTIENCLCKKMNGENMLEHLCERMDRLEALCMRIEDYVQKSFNMMERRLQLVESCQMHQNHSLMTKIESDTAHSGLPVLSNSLSSSSVSGTEMLKNGDWRRMSAAELPSLSYVEVPSLIPLPRACSVSSSECSPVCAIVSRTTLPSDVSCMGVSKDVESEDMESLHCAGKPSARAGFDNSPNLVLDEASPGNLDQQDLSREEHCGDKDHLKADNIEVYAGSEVSSKPTCEPQITPNKPILSLEEALASALSAFSTSVHPVQVETTCTFMETPSLSSETENTENNECCEHDGLHSSEVETIAFSTRKPCSSVVDTLDDEEVCYHVNTYFNTLEGVRFISQESMDLVTYTSRGRQDAKKTVYRERKISGAHDGLALSIEQSTNPGAEIVVNHEKEIMLVEDESKHKLDNSRIMLDKNVFGEVHASSCEQEANDVHDFKEQLLPLEGCYNGESSKLFVKPTESIIVRDHKMVGDQHSSFNCVSGNSQSQVLSLDMEEIRGEITGGQDRFTEADNKHGPRKLNIDQASLLDVSFTTSNVLQTKMSLEFLLYDHTPEKGRETLSLQKINETETLNSPELKRPNALFFVEDEGLGDFIIPGTSTTLCSVTSGNLSNQGMIPGISPGFESLL